MKLNHLPRANRYLTSCTRLVLGLSLTGLAPLALATDYYTTFILNADVSYNDNLRMTESNKIDATKYLLTPVFKAAASTETTTVQFASTFFFNRYDKDIYDSDDQNISLALSHEFEHSVAQFSAGIIRDSTITSEVETSGVVGDQADRTERYYAAPSWTYTLNESNQLAFNGNYTTQNYENKAYTGYDSWATSVDWTHILTERLKLVLSGSYSKYKLDERPFLVPGQFVPFDTIFGQRVLVPNYFGTQEYQMRSVDKGFQIGADYQWSEQTMIQARFGRSRNKQTTDTSDPNNICSDSFYLELKDFGYNPGGECTGSFPSESSSLSTARLDWTWHTERQSINFNATQQTQPSSNGYVVKALLAGTSWNYSLTEHDTLSATLNAVRNRGINSDSTFRDASLADRDYASASLTYKRQLTENWFVNATYRYSEQEYKQSDSQTSSRVASVGIRWQPQESHWAR